jgi:2-polyprenyl-3-methyl-5-hydroxy-6-metoxy-1,4-benzoquinol methylase
MTVQDHYEEYWRRASPPPLGDPLTSARLGLLRDELARVEARRVLDVGCGTGGLVGALAADGLDAMGIDISSEAIDRAEGSHQGCTFVVHSIEDVPWPIEEGSFDVVVAFELIEHLIRPRRLLEGARIALAPGGHLAVSTPYHGLLKNLALALLAFERHFAVEGDHIRFFTDGGLRRLLEETGFRVERISHLGRFWGVWAGSFVWARKM